MIPLNSNGGPSVLALLPTTMAYRHESSASVRDSLRGLMGIAPTTAPTTPADAAPGDAASLTRFRAVVAELGSALNLTAEDRAALEANPAEREVWLKQHDDREEQAEKEAQTAAKAAAADRVRRTSTALLLAQGARARK